MSFGFSSMFVSSYNQFSSKTPIWKTISNAIAIDNSASVSLSLTLKNDAVYHVMANLYNNNANTDTYQIRFANSAVAANYLIQTTTVNNNVFTGTQGNIIPTMPFWSSGSAGDILDLYIKKRTGQNIVFWTNTMHSYDTGTGNIVQRSVAGQYVAGGSSPYSTTLDIVLLGLGRFTLNSKIWLLEYDYSGV